MKKRPPKTERWRKQLVVDFDSGNRDASGTCAAHSISLDVAEACLTVIELAVSFVDPHVIVFSNKWDVFTLPAALNAGKNLMPRESSNQSLSGTLVFGQALDT